MKSQQFKSGDKILYQDREVYEFGYYSQAEGKCIVYKEGERNFQDSFCLELDQIELVTPSKSEPSIESLQAENRQLKMDLVEIIWMARRYAHGRKTYAPQMVNEVIDRLLKTDCSVSTDEVVGGLYAEDGSFGSWDPKSQIFKKSKNTFPTLDVKAQK